MEKLIVYTKFCLPCVMPEFWDMFQKEALKQGYGIKVCRTTYRPFAHKKATEIWGADGYTAFGVFPDGQAIALERIMDMWRDNAKNKLVKAGKKKSARKGKNDVQRLPKTSRSIRVDSVESPATKIKVENA